MEFNFCDIEGCIKEAKYGIYEIKPDSTRRWLKVCKEHEEIIGKSNLEWFNNLEKKRREDGTGTSNSK